MNFLKENERSKIIFALNLLSDKLESGYKLESLNMKDDCLIFINGDKQEKLSIKKMMEPFNKEALTNSEVDKSNSQSLSKDMELETTEIIEKVRNEPVKADKIGFSETSVMKGGEYINFSETSEMYEISEMSDMSKLLNVSNKMKGGFTDPHKNIFQKSKYSETSSLKQTDMSNFSATSTELFNGRSDKYSDTSDIKGQVGGKSNLTSDTLIEISELKQRKVSKTTPKLDMGIFTKKTQSGGSADNIKRKMMEIGINSNSSTSSICE